MLALQKWPSFALPEGKERINRRKTVAASFPASDDTVPTIERATRGSIDITTEQKSRTADLKEDSAPALMQAFFEGAGISPLDAAQAGFDTEFMRALGALARTLIAKRPG